MALVLIIDLIVVCGLVGITLSKGFERALPFASFMLIFLPIESSIPLGLFQLTTQRLIVVELLLLYFLIGRGQSELRGNGSMPLKALIMIHIAWCALSTAHSVVPLMSIKKAVSVILEYYTLYFVYWRTVTKAITVRNILFAIVCGVIVCSVFGAFEAYGGGNVISLLPTATHNFALGPDSDREDRVQSTFDHPILFGAALAMAITFAIYLLTVVEKRWQVALLWVGLMLMFLNIYKTSSRGPWLDVILGCLMLSVLGSKGSKRILYAIGTLALVTMIVRPGIWSTVKGIYDNSFDMNTSTGSSYQYRYALKDAVVRRLLEDSGRTLWGYGLESFYDLEIEGDFLGSPHLFLSCDSSWVELMVETGFVGLAIIVMLLLNPAWKAWRDYRSFAEPERYLSLILFINLVIFYFQMYSVGMYSWGQNGYVLWIVVALTFAFARCQETAAESEESEKPILFDVVAPKFQTT